MSFLTCLNVNIEQYLIYRKSVLSRQKFQNNFWTFDQHLCKLSKKNFFFYIFLSLFVLPRLESFSSIKEMKNLTASRKTWLSDTRQAVRKKLPLLNNKFEIISRKILSSKTRKDIWQYWLNNISSTILRRQKCARKHSSYMDPKRSVLF